MLRSCPTWDLSTPCVSARTRHRTMSRRTATSSPSQRGAMFTGRARGWQHGRFWANDPDCLIVRPEVDRREAWRLTSSDGADCAAAATGFATWTDGAVAHDRGRATITDIRGPCMKHSTLNGRPSTRGPGGCRYQQREPRLGTSARGGAGPGPRDRQGPGVVAGVGRGASGRLWPHDPGGGRPRCRHASPSGLASTTKRVEPDLVGTSREQP